MACCLCVLLCATVSVVVNVVLVVNGDWSRLPEPVAATAGSVPSLYFCQTKLEVWTVVADQAVEACRSTHAIISRYFYSHRRDVVSKLVG